MDKKEIKIPVHFVSKFDNMIARKNNTIPWHESPVYFEPDKISNNEEFKIARDSIVNNIEPDRYLVSNQGRVIDLKLNKEMGLVANSTKRAKPYYKLKMSYFENVNTRKSKDVYIHRAVLESFKPITHEQVELGMTECDHIDSDHTNNKIDNLQWTTGKENVRLAKVRGTIPSGIDSATAVIKDERIVHNICKLLQAGCSPAEINHYYYPDISASLISNIKCGNSYNNISKYYTMPEKRKFAEKTTEETVHEICKLLELNYSPTQISRKCNVGRYIVNDIKFKRNFKEISSQYNF